MRRLVSILLLISVLLCTAGCSGDTKSADGKIKIVTTIFPCYDFARAVAGDLGEVSMLISPGAEAHEYEPTPKEILSVANCDLFIYTGGESEEWAESITEASGISSEKVITFTDFSLLLEEELSEGMEGETESGEIDEHTWLSLKNAERIINGICDYLVSAFPEYGDKFRENARRYNGVIEEIYNDAVSIVKNADRDILIFADRFPARYFAHELGLKYYAAFPGCSAQSEASAKTLVYLCDKVKEEKIPYIFYIEFSSRKVADAVSENTGAGQLLFHSCHNISPEDFESGVTYTDLMRGNADNLRKALN